MGTFIPFNKEKKISPMFTPEVKTITKTTMFIHHSYSTKINGTRMKLNNMHD